MNNKPIIVVSGEPYSIFSEIFYKVFKSSFYKKYKRPIILIGSKNIIEMQMKKMNYSCKINLIKKNEIKNVKLSNKKINLINVKLNFKKPFNKITNKSSKYIQECFDIAINIMKKKLGFALINGPISKKHFFHGKYNGITEYLAYKTYKKNNEVMLIYNKLLSVCPITTHIPLKDVSKKISSNQILKKIITINKFYITNLKKIPKFAVTGLNPHCESNFKNNEDVRDTSEIIIEGYRVQALVTRNTHSADSIRAVLSDKIDEDVYITYEVPYYKIRVGNCVDRKQAEELKLKLVELGYASAWIIRTRVKAPEFIREY